MTARRGWAVILVSVIALTLVWRFLPAGSPPIYDGQCIANPYETLGGTPAPGKATKTFPKAATFPPAEVYTNEMPPQAQILIGGRHLRQLDVCDVEHHAGDAALGKTAERHHRRQRLPDHRGQRIRDPARTAVAVKSGVHHPAGAGIVPCTDDRPFQRHIVDADCHLELRVRQHLRGDVHSDGRLRRGEAWKWRRHPAPSGGGIPIAAIIGGLVLLLIIVVAVLFSLDRRRTTAR